MKLTAPLFNQVVAALGPAREEPEPAGADAASAAEKRGDRRLAFDTGVLMKPHGVESAQPRMVRLQNLSRSGAAVLDGVTRQIGEKVVLYLPRDDGSTIPLVCAVMNTRMSGGAFRLGMQFVALDEQPEQKRGGRGARNGERKRQHVLDELALHGVDPAPADDEAPVRVDAQGLMCGDEYGHRGLTRFVTLHEVSRAGTVSVLHPELLARGVRFTLQLACPSGEMLTMSCTTTDSRFIDESNCLIQARFDVRPGPGSGRAEEAAARSGLMGRLKKWFAA